MLLLRSLDEFPKSLRHGAVSIGNFDGVHRGHARLIEGLRAEADLVDGPAVVFTLDPHPAKVLRPDQTPPSLSWTERKASLLGELGVDAVIAYPTDRDLLEMEAPAFFQKVILDRLAARAMVEGPNFFFGHNRSGNLEVLDRLCRQAGVILKVAGAAQTDGQIISSSRIRRLVADGDVQQAAGMLTQPYRIRGEVVRGEGRGRRLGYPTANLAHIDTLVPGHGIYGGRAWVDGVPWPAATSIGPNLTFDEDQAKVEAHLLGFDGTLYGHTIELDFLVRVRDIERFDSAESLIARMRQDVETVRQVVDAT